MRSFDNRLPQSGADPEDEGIRPPSIKLEQQLHAAGTSLTRLIITRFNQAIQTRKNLERSQPSHSDTQGSWRFNTFGQLATAFAYSGNGKVAAQIIAAMNQLVDPKICMQQTNALGYQASLAASCSAFLKGEHSIAVELIKEANKHLSTLKDEHRQGLPESAYVAFNSALGFLSIVLGDKFSGFKPLGDHIAGQLEYFLNTADEGKQGRFQSKEILSSRRCIELVGFRLSAQLGAGGKALDALEKCALDLSGRARILQDMIFPMLQHGDQEIVNKTLEKMLKVSALMRDTKKDDFVLYGPKLAKALFLVGRTEESFALVCSINEKLAPQRLKGEGVHDEEILAGLNVAEAALSKNWDNIQFEALSHLSAAITCLTAAGHQAAARELIERVITGEALMVMNKPPPREDIVREALTVPEVLFYDLDFARKKMEEDTSLSPLTRVRILIEIGLMAFRRGNIDAVDQLANELAKSYRSINSNRVNYEGLALIFGAGKRTVLMQQVLINNALKQSKDAVPFEGNLNDMTTALKIAYHFGTPKIIQHWYDNFILFLNDKMPQTNLGLREFNQVMDSLRYAVESVQSIHERLNKLPGRFFMLERELTIVNKRFWQNSHN